MPDSLRYFDLPLAEQAEVLHGLAPVLGRRAEILEKDIWLCQALGALFALPVCKPMAFKGGTSLSKVYQAIERFSEDIDVTIDYRSLVPNVPELATLSNTQRKKLSDTLKVALIDHVTQELVPALRDALTQQLPGAEISLEVSEDAEKLWLFYPSAVENTDAYLRPSVLIEFGGRNATLPQDTLTIVPDAAPHVPGLVFPKAQVAVLSPLRTFWEKATLIHVECHRPDLRVSAERLSRHWYDLARLVFLAHRLQASVEHHVDQLQPSRVELCQVAPAQIVAQRAQVGHCNELLSPLAASRSTTTPRSAP